MQHFTLRILLSWCSLVFCMGTSLPRGLSAMSQNSIGKFKVQLQHSLEGARIRRKRQAGLVNSVSRQGFTADRLRVGNSAPGDLPSISGLNLTMWTSFRFQDRDQVFVGTRHGDLVLLDVTDKDKVAQPVALSAGEVVGHKAKAFSDGDQQWFVVLYSSDARRGIQLYQRVGRGLERGQSIGLDAEADIDLITVRGIHYLAVSTYGTMTNHGYSYHGRVTLYHWMRTQFDAVAFRETFGARSVSCWTSDGALYLSVAQEINDEGDMMLGSPVYLFNAKDGDSLLLVDKLRTTGPRKVAHFGVAGSHYLMFTGYHHAEIFWWTNDQFLLWQTIPGTAGASDVSVLSLQNGEVVLVISLKEEILFLTLDAAGHYVVTFTMQFSGFGLESLQFMFDGRDYYALALFAASERKLPHPVWKLTLDKYDLPDLTAIDPLIQCLGSLRDLAKQRENELDVVQMDLNRVWLTNKDHVVVADVVVKGSAVATLPSHVVVDAVVIKTRDEVLGVTLPGIRKNVSANFAEKGMLAAKLGSVLMKSRDQVIPGSKFFTASVFLPTLRWASATSNVFINGLEVNRLAAQALKKNGDQVFEKQLVVNDMYAGAIDSVAVDGIELNDLVLLTGDYEIGGKWVFHDIRGYEILAARIGGIPVDSLITTNTDQNIEELKTVHTMSSRVINVRELMSGEKLSELYEKTVSLGTTQEIHSSLQFQSSLNVRGNILVSGTAGEVDLEALEKETVKKFIPQNVTGFNVFSRGIIALKNVVLEGLVNDVALDQAATLHGNQILNGNIDFQSTVNIHRNLWNSVVNGKDLNIVAVIRNKHQFVEGNKHFSNFVAVDNIEASDTITINGVDVSAEAATVVRHKQGLVENASPVFQNVVVKGNVTAYDGINDFKVYDLPSTIWLKSYPQVIPAALHTGTPVVTENDVKVGKVKGKELQADFIHVFGNEIIGDDKVFQHDVHVRRNARVATGKLFDGADIAALTNEAYYDKVQVGSIHGKKSMHSLAVQGSIHVGSINGMELSRDFLNPYAGQYIKGDAWMNAEPLIAAGDLYARNMAVEFFNGKSFMAFLNNATRPRISAKEFKNKTFNYLNAEEIILADFGRIDGVSLPDMNRVVRLDIPQTILSKKDFLSPVYFSDDCFAASVNDIDLVNFINDVILIDDEREILGTKTFYGPVLANQLNLGHISGININELAENVMSKTEDNSMEDLVFFGRSAEIETLFVTPPALIDGLLISEAIKVDEAAILNGTTFHLTNTNVASDLFSYRLVNGCDLNEIVDFALRKMGADVQAFEKASVLENLEVGKHLNTLRSINEVGLEKLKSGLIAVDSHQIVAGDLYIYPGVSVAHLNMKGFVNSSELAYLSSDVVMKSSVQNITGHKVLPELEVDFLTGTSNLLVTDALNNVYLEKLSQNTVWKQGFQTVQGEKILDKLISWNLSFHGYLNGLRIPYDVHLASDPETISPDVHFARGIQIFADLAVRGQVDGVDMASFDQLVSLTADETVASRVTFAGDISADRLFVDGMINDIVPQMVVSTSQDYHVHGFKMFSSLHIGNLNVQHVNGIDVFGLVANIVSCKRNETLTRAQVFAQPIYVQDAVNSGQINELSLPLLSEMHQERAANLQTALGFLQQLRADQDKVVTAQIASTGQTMDFAYFVLYQEVDIAGATRMLTSQMSITKKLNLMSAWTNRVYCHASSCCSVDYSYWFSVRMDGKIYPSGGPQNGRYFLVDNEGMTENIVVWTNSTASKPEWCRVGLEETVIGVLRRDGHFEAQHRIMNSPVVTDVAAFEDGSVYLVAAYRYDSANDVYSETIVYEGDTSTREWKEHQKIPVYGALSMDLTLQSQEVLLALGSGIGNYPDSHSSIYKWNTTTRTFDLLQSILSQHVTSVRWVRAGRHALLAVAGTDQWFEELSKCPDVISGGQIDIYVYEIGLTWLQSIPLGSVVSMASFEIEGGTYLAAVSRQMQSVYILQWRGYSRFEIIQSIYAREVHHVTTYYVREEIYLVLSGAGPSKVLKAVVRGAGTVMSTVTVMEYKEPSEQGDQPTSSQNVVSTC